MINTMLVPGNWVLYNETQGVILDIYGSTMVCISDLQDARTTAAINDLDGIPITGEVLVRWGFVKHDNIAVALPPSYQLTIAQDIAFEIQLFAWAQDCSRVIIRGVPSIEFKHLHEIQNFFEATTGKKLEPCKP